MQILTSPQCGFHLRRLELASKSKAIPERFGYDELLMCWIDYASYAHVLVHKS